MATARLGNSLQRTDVGIFSASRTRGVPRSLVAGNASHDIHPFRSGSAFSAANQALRGASTTTSSPSSTPKANINPKPSPIAQESTLLASQRLKRPLSPHLGVYKVEQTFFGSSAWMRITGCTLSGAFYAVFASYFLAPILGLGFDTSSLAAGFGALPGFVKGSVKLGIVFPFVFHFFKGIEQLFHDAGGLFDRVTLKWMDYSLWAVSAVASPIIAFGL